MQGVGDRDRDRDRQRDLVNGRVQFVCTRGLSTALGENLGAGTAKIAYLNCCACPAILSVYS